MSRLATSFILGYHGCDRAIADRAVQGEAEILQSDRDYDWLGPGAYFWEADPARALEWAKGKVATGAYADAAVVGAVIDLRNCLDLTSRDDVELLRAAHASFLRVQKLAGLPIPKNRNPRGVRDRDRALRFLDCAVLRHLHEIMTARATVDPQVAVFDTVRGMFAEGGPAYPGSGLFRRSHTQIAVRNPACIKGVFRPLGLD